jgi:nucleotidyltransferase/DNA polymerase involved in DNA repair
MRSPALDATSVALLSTEGGTCRTVWQVSERAAEVGVRPGQLVSQAISLCPALTILEPDPVHYDAAQDTLLEVLAELTPVVEPAGRGRVFLGMDGLARLYGSPYNQVLRVLRTLFRVLPAPLVAATRAGLAPGKFGAWVAAAGARPGDPMIVPEGALRAFLASRPVSALPVEESTLDQLERLGVHTLGELVRFPAPALVGQFGEEGGRARAWATGERIDAVQPWYRPLPIRVALDFAVPVGQVEMLNRALDRLLERALARPERCGRSVTALRVIGRLEGSGLWMVDAVLRDPTASKESLAFTLRSRIVLSPPPRAVEALTVELFRFSPPSSQTVLFDRKDSAGRVEQGRDLADGAVPHSLRNAVRELKLRLGHSPLYLVVEADPLSRIPERRHTLLSLDP